ncbi:MAG: NAD(P)-dependent oxidoreductase [Wenzhouxiangella sp.]|nr:NAD(P)-dependent oxidoreductase [Wenzhouxiangella sp.]
MSTPTVGWIGLGAMGWPMAGHLHAQGMLKAVWNRSADKAEAFVEQHPNTMLAADPVALASEVDVVVMCVSADQDVLGLIDQLVGHLRADQIVIDHSTIAPATAETVAQRLADVGVSAIDAPVTGGVEGAIQGTLSVLAGGDWAAFQKVEPVLGAYAKVTQHLGAAGRGQAGKAVNQLMVAGIAEAVSESLALLEALDLPKEAMLELLSGGAAGSWFLDKRGHTMLEDRFDVGFAPDLLVKDLKICESVATQAGIDSGVLKQAIPDYEKVVATDQTSRDISALIRLKRR